MLTFLIAAIVPSRAAAWPGDLSRSIAHDALKLLPKSLADLFLAHEEAILSEAKGAKNPALSLVYADLSKGRLSAATKAALAQEASRRSRALQGQEFREAVISLGAAYRLAVDLADPGVSSRLGSDETARVIRREFYLFVASNRDKIPLVIAEPASMNLRLDALPGFLDEVTQKTSAQAALLRTPEAVSHRGSSATRPSTRSSGPAASAPCWLRPARARPADPMRTPTKSSRALSRASSRCGRRPRQGPSARSPASGRAARRGPGPW